MKKFLIAVIILIPVIVLFSIMLTGAVISAVIPVIAEEMIIQDINDIPLDTTRSFTLPLVGEGMQIIIIVLPSISYNADIEYALTEDSVGSVRLVKQEERGQKYIIQPVSPGEVGLVIYPKSNYNLKKVINIYITSNYITDFSIAVDEHTISGAYKLDTTTKLYANFYPAEAIGSNIITWSSSNNDIVNVDNNGVAHIIGAGVATIRARVEDLSQSLHTAEIEIDTTEALVKANKVYLSNDSGANNEEWVRQELVLKNDARIDRLEANQELSIYHIAYGGREAEIAVYNIPPSQEWDIIDLEHFTLDEERRITVYIDNGGYFLSAARLDYLDNLHLDAVFTSSNENIFKVTESGMIIPISQGIAVVRATLSNGEYKELEVKVLHRANTFLLNLTEMDNKAGIKLERVWGYNFINKGEDANISEAELTHEYQVFYHQNSATFRGVTINDFRLFWEVENPSYADIDERTGKLAFKEAACGRDVKVIATELVHGVKTKLAKSYTFKVLADKDAVNVQEKDLELECGSHHNIINYFSNNRRLAIALQTDIFVEMNEMGDSYYAIIKNSFYGNGYTVSTQNVPMRYDKNNGYKPITGNEKGVHRTSKTFMIKTKDIVQELEELTLENIFFKGTAIDGSGAVRLEDFESRSTGILVEVDNDGRDIPIRFKYNYIKYFSDGIRIFARRDANFSYDILIEGSIIGDCYRFPINMEHQTFYPKSLITFRNIVFTPSIGPSIMVMPHSLGSGFTLQDLKEKVIVNISFEGFIDNYNWKRLNQLDSVFIGLFDPEWLDANPEVNKVLQNLLKEEMAKLLAKDRYAELKYTDDKDVEWISLMGFITGVWNDLDPRAISIKSKSYESLNLYMPTAKDGLVGAILSIFQQVDMLKVQESPNSSNKVPMPMDKPCYVISYKFKNNQPEILPGQPCPNDEALLKRLQGK